jgi:hypothetical protein
LHFHKISQLDLRKNVVDIVNKREVIWVLKGSKPEAILAKLKELFQRRFPLNLFPLLRPL